MRQGQRDIWIIVPDWGDHVSLASSAATSCKTSHSSGVSAVNIGGIKVLFISCDEMIRGNRFSTAELNVVFEVWPCGGESVVEDRLAHWDKLNPLQDCLRISSGTSFVSYPPSEEIKERKSECGSPALDFLRPTGQVEHAEAIGPTTSLCHHVNQDIDVDENLQSVNLRAMISRIRALSSLTEFSGWIPTRPRRSGSMGTFGQHFDNTSRSLSPCCRSASSRSFCSRSKCSCRSSARKVPMSSSRTSLSNSSSCSGVFAMMREIIDGGGSRGQARLKLDGRRETSSGRSEQ